MTGIVRMHSSDATAGVPRSTLGAAYVSFHSCCNERNTTRALDCGFLASKASSTLPPVILVPPWVGSEIHLQLQLCVLVCATRTGS
jgi:hypothetical protein